MASLEKISRDMERAQEKIAEWQGRYKELSSLYTEQENLHIVAVVRALKMTREELSAFIKNGTLPAAVTPSMPAVRYPRKNKTETIDSGTDDTEVSTIFETESEEKENE